MQSFSLQNPFIQQYNCWPSGVVQSANIKAQRHLFSFLDFLVTQSISSAEISSSMGAWF
jgi:hypothetical protein